VDSLTHSLFAVTLGRTPLGRGGGTTVALVVASNMPDIDIVATAWGALDYLRWHRGPTHGSLAIVGLALPAAGIAWLWNRFREKRSGATLWPPARFSRLFLISMLGIALHLAMDVTTSYGTRLLSPFDWTWYSLDWMPITDIYLLVALGAGLVFGGKSPDKRRKAATVALVLMAANYAIRGVAHHQALASARIDGLVPDQCSRQAVSWFSPERWPVDATGDSANCLARMAALPTFGSPLAWTIVAPLRNGYELRDLNILARPDPTARPARRFFPNAWTPEVVKASHTRLGQIYLGFSRFPAADSLVTGDGSTVVRWSDMRFVTSIRRTDEETEGAAFSAVVRLDRSGTVVGEHFGPLRTESRTDQR
jgi:inner membrane protein